MYTPSPIPQDTNQLSNFLSLELNNIADAQVDWSKVANTPTTVEGYGITNSARTDAVPTFAGGVSGIEGGEIHLKKPPTSSTLTGDVVIDVYGNTLRIFEGASNFRGVYLDLTDCANSIGTNILTPAWANITGKPTSPASGNWWTSGYPIINSSNGVMEIGRYIDFHSTDTSTADYTYRLDNSSNGVLTTSGALTVGENLNCSGVIYPSESSGQMFVNTSGSKGLEIKSDGGTTSAAYISFHRPGSYALHFGLATNNKLSVGGWSMGSAQYEIFHQGNIPSYFAKSASSNGYQELPSGIIIQWGTGTSSGTTYNNAVITLPTSVSTAVYSATATIAGTGSGAFLIQVSSSTTSSITFTVSNGGGSYLSGIGFRWIAICY